jgi:hypothetical protein
MKWEGQNFKPFWHDMAEERHARGMGTAWYV